MRTLYKKKTKIDNKQLSRIRIKPDDVAVALCRKSFYDFVKEFWGVLVADKFLDNWHIKYLCDEIQIVAERVIRNQPKKYDLLINISPGSTKSTITSIMLPAWMWTRMPHASVIGASHTHELAIDLSRKNRTIVKSEKYCSFFPEIRVTSDQDAKGYFINTKAGARFSAGIKGDVTGRHGHLVMIDDPVDPEQGRSDTENLTACTNIKEKLSNRVKDPIVAPFIMIMQRLNENDPTGMMLKKWPNPVRHICLPAELTDDVKPEECKKFYRDGLMFPERHPREYLDGIKTHGDYYYAGQYLQSPIPTGGAMFHVENFNFATVAPKKWRMRMRYWDKAATQDGGMYTVGVLMGKDMEDRYWVLDVLRGRWDTYRRERMMRQTADLDGVAVYIGIEQEPGSSGKDSATATVRNLAGYKVRMDRPTGDKVARADPFSSVVNGGQVTLIKAPWNDDYINELRYFGPDNTNYKDQVDASSGAFKYVSKPIIKVGGWKL